MPEDTTTPADAPAIETLNKFFVALSGAGNVVCLRALPQTMSREDALLLAAWLVAIADDGSAPTFKQVLQAVRNS